MKSHPLYFRRLIVIASIIAFILFSCKKDELQREAKVDTKTITEVLATTAKATGDIIDLGKGISEYGHCWGFTENPTISDFKTSLGVATKAGVYTSELENLEPGKTYHVRSYLISGEKVVFGNEKEFTTLDGLVNLTTTDITNITINSATSGGNVASVNGDVVLARGICWDTLAYVSMVKKIGFIQSGTGLGQFTGELTGLIAGMKYYVKAWAKTNIDTTYAESKIFTTLSGIATLTTTVVNSVNANTAASGGNITYDGGTLITARGVCWSTTQNPTTVDSKTIDGYGTGSFTSSITGLNHGTIYYLKAYATNSVATSYGNQQTFNTKDGVATITTTSPDQITATMAVSGGNIADDGGSAISTKGICWSRTPNPTTENSKTTDGSGAGSYISNLSSLEPGQTYYVRAYAINSITTSYGNQKTFNTKDGKATLTTIVPDQITVATAVSGGNIFDDGGSAISNRGVCWDTTPNPTIANSKTTDGTGTGSYISYISGLQLGHAYYVRAYATNSITTNYGDQQLFTTRDGVIKISTLTMNNITLTTSESGGDITDDGGSPISARGVCWSEKQNPTTEDSKTYDGSGTGSFTSSITGLTINTPYYLRSYATNSISTDYGNEIVFTLWINQPGPQVNDIVGNSYNSVKIGTQIWMGENLRTTRYNDNSFIPHVVDNIAWASLNTPGYCWYDNDPYANLATYGALYNWYTVNMDNLCPIGWHVPTDSEWNTLLIYLGGTSLSESGFAALPGGGRNTSGYFVNIGNFGLWWTATEYEAIEAYYYSLPYNSPSANRSSIFKRAGASVRCLQDF